MDAATRRAALREVAHAEATLAALRAELEAGRKGQVRVMAASLEVNLAQVQNFTTRGAVEKTYGDGSVGYSFAR